MELGGIGIGIGIDKMELTPCLFESHICELVGYNKKWFIDYFGGFKYWDERNHQIPV